MYIHLLLFHTPFGCSDGQQWDHGIAILLIGLHKVAVPPANKLYYSIAILLFVKSYQQNSNAMVPLLSICSPGAIHEVAVPPANKLYYSIAILVI